jgi:hypothetical protein
MFDQTLLDIYRIFRYKGGRKSNWIENHLCFDGRITVSSDELRNEKNAYAALFSEENRQNLEELYLKLLNKMKGVPYEQCEDIMEALIFLQETSANALWKHNQIIGIVIEEFVRDYDRLDVQSERARLHEKAQSN